jgi:hypothetical protein
MVGHDQAITTNYFKKNIFIQAVQSRYRLCKEYEEIIDPLTSGCSTLAKNCSICKRTGVETTENWHFHIPKS